MSEVWGTRKQPDYVGGVGTRRQPDNVGGVGDQEVG